VSLIEVDHKLPFMAAGSWFLAVVTAGMALAQLRFAHVARRRESGVAKGSVAHFRFASFAYGATATLAVVAAVSSSSLAFGLAVIGLIVAAGTGSVFRTRHRIAMFRRKT
jgi:hypothetical protein